VRSTPARTLAAAGTAGAGAAAAAVAYLKVGGLPGILYAAGICLTAFFGAVAIVAGRSAETEVRLELEPAATPRPPRWRRKSRVIAELELDLAATHTELDEHRHALANLATQLSRETEAAQRNAAQLEQRIEELEAERDGLLEVVARERERFEQTLEDLGGGIGRHGNELAELERELEALIAR
jgi:flagellar motility protein MotE (MotC chaperone)